MGERDSLEFEVNYHRARIAELSEELRDIEENLAHVSDPPPVLVREAQAIRMELKGRSFAVAVGSSRLMVLPKDD
jgi:hypothetical protein